MAAHHQSPNADYLRWNDIVATAQRDLTAIAALETLGNKDVSQYTDSGAKRPSTRARQKASRLLAAAANGITVS